MLLDARHNLKIIELPVPLIYLDEERSFGGALDAGETRLAYYRDVIDRAEAAAGQACGQSGRRACGDGAG